MGYSPLRGARTGRPGRFTPTGYLDQGAWSAHHYRLPKPGCPDRVAKLVTVTGCPEGGAQLLHRYRVPGTGCLVGSPLWCAQTRVLGWFTVTGCSDWDDLKWLDGKGFEEFQEVMSKMSLIAELLSPVVC